MLGLAYSGCNKMAAIVFLTMATAANGAVSTGPLASFVDLSPNYASKYWLEGVSSLQFNGYIKRHIWFLITEW